MRWFTCFALALCWPALSADEPVQKVVYGGRVFGNDPLPVPDKGHLFFLNHKAGISLYGPDGTRKFDTALQGPDGQTPSAMSAAIDTDGAIAVSAGVTLPYGYGGALVFLDSAGKQTRFVLTGRYVPAHICFDQNHSIWAFGWQRDDQE